MDAFTTRLSPSGFTLIELLVVLFIGSIVATVVLPSFSGFVDRSKIRATTNQIIRELTFARETAITSNTPVTICPSEDGAVCAQHWSDNFIIFYDRNTNGSIDEEDSILRESTSGDDWRLEWNAFGGKSSITYTSLGFTNHQNGTFSLCPSRKNIALGQLIVINKAGRIRLAQDSDGNGWPEKSNGKDMSCD
ncbi:GspH/FimT family pseudopilin [Aurantivibrio plasticivorans]